MRQRRSTSCQPARPALPRRPAIERTARAETRLAPLPRPLLDDTERPISASVASKRRYAIRFPPVIGSAPAGRADALNPQEVADIAASFQEAVIDCLSASRIGPKRAAMAFLRGRRRCGNGVSDSLGGSAAEQGYGFRRPLAGTDNAVMERSPLSGSEPARSKTCRSISILDQSAARRQPSPHEKTRPEAWFRPRSIVLRPNCRKPPAPSAVLLPALTSGLAAAAGPASIQPREFVAALTRTYCAGNLDNTAARPTCCSSGSSAIRPNQFGPSS